MEFGLHSVYPNPFNNLLRIEYGIETPGQVELKVYDLSGRIAGVLRSKDHVRGNYSISWDAGQLPAGLYFLKLEAGQKRQITKIQLLK